jgi:DNA-binding MarR family transcriptional regulator
MSSARVDAYVPLVRRFASRSLTFHATVAERLGINSTDLKSLQLLGDRWLTTGEIADNLGVTPAAATLMVDRLEGGFRHQKPQ